MNPVCYYNASLHTLLPPSAAKVESVPTLGATALAVDELSNLSRSTANFERYSSTPIYAPHILRLPSKAERPCRTRWLLTTRLCTMSQRKKEREKKTKLMKKKSSTHQPPYQAATAPNTPNPGPSNTHATISSHHTTPPPYPASTPSSHSDQGCSIAPARAHLCPLPLHLPSIRALAQGTQMTGMVCIIPLARRLCVLGRAPAREGRMLLDRVFS